MTESIPAAKTAVLGAERETIAVQASVYEVGPRDGLQNESTLIPLQSKAAFVRMLVGAGLRRIEATSFVSPRLVPQLADADALARLLPSAPWVEFSALVLNRRGLERATQAGLSGVAVLVSATEAFAQHNLACRMEEASKKAIDLVSEARLRGLWTRCYVTVAFGCPYEGHVDEVSVAELVATMHRAGADEVCVADTIGIAVPGQVRRLLRLTVASGVPPTSLAVHFHDTRGTALANCYEALQAGLLSFDSSTGGTGGCPFAPGAGGNLATEDLVWAFQREGLFERIDHDAVVKAARYMAEELAKPLTSRTGKAPSWPRVPMDEQYRV